jgi:hypothetical protein
MSPIVKAFVVAGVLWGYALFAVWRTCRGSMLRLGRLPDEPEADTPEL